MPLCKPKAKTPALLAACRANARKGTGPRTPEGKCRSRLNALKHGRYSPSLRESLVEAGRTMAVKQFDFIRTYLMKFLPPVTQEQARETDRLVRQVWCWAERKEKIGRKQRSSIDSANYPAATLPFARLPIRDRKGQTLVTVTLGYQSRRVGAGRSVARVALTLTPGKGSRVFQEAQMNWRAAWVLSKMPVLETGARTTPKSFKELQEAVAAHVAEPPVTGWRPEVMIWLRPARYCEPVPCRPRRRLIGANSYRSPSGPAGLVEGDSGLGVRGSQKRTSNGHGLFANPEPRVPSHQLALHGISGWISRLGLKVSAKLGWMEKLMGLFGRKRNEPERPDPPDPPKRTEPIESLAMAEDGRALNPSAFEGPPLSKGYAYGKDFCKVLDYAECFSALLAGRNRGAENRKGMKK
ncbi:MAG TPA: hypothetical protein VKM93_04600 [Terriglobia bacterium]|nr:hypothetical protein [Terriglobia bacterium]